jgi:hypothetical protein
MIAHIPHYLSQQIRPHWYKCSVDFRERSKHFRPSIEHFGLREDFKILRISLTVRVRDLQLLLACIAEQIFAAIQDPYQIHCVRGLCEVYETVAQVFIGLEING